MSTQSTNFGPCVPTTSARTRQRPLAGADLALMGGLWGDWQRRNRSASLRIAMERLELAGNLDNLRIAAGEREGKFIDPVFMDSDVYKVLEAIGWELAHGPDAELEAFFAQTVALLGRAQEPSGYLNSWGQLIAPTQHFEKMTFSHELYCAGHLFQAAVAARRGFGDETLLAVATKVADHIVDVFLTGGHRGIDGHPEVETGLVELYRETGRPAYLDLARHFIDGRGHGSIGHHGGLSYIQDHLPYRDTETLVGHAVRALYLEAGAMDVYAEAGDRTLLDASIRHWDDVVATKTSISGGQGSRYAWEAFGDRYELPPDRSYNETCAAIASIHWSWRLLLATGEARYADLIERTLHNAFAASTSHDGGEFFYANLLQRRADHLDGESLGRRSRWFSCACCPPNIMRLIASLEHYLATRTDTALIIHQYMPARIGADLAAGPLAVTMATDYPFDGRVTLTVTAAPVTAATLGLRIPAWSRATTATLNGAALAPRPGAYLEIERIWAMGDTVTLIFDMAPRLVYPHARIDALRGTAALERGPLVYCFEQTDQAAGLDIETVMLGDTAPITVGAPQTLPQLGHTVPLRVAVAALIQTRPSGLPFSPTPTPPHKAPTGQTATAVPYFQWDNRDDGPMRIFLPTLRGV
ncbi:MAG TPA: beta-L-arabinofuranosidase domain-containing protein [Devosiaceae bacterium]|jgi:hypothetical protein